MGEPHPSAAIREHLRKQLKRDLGPYRTHLKELLEHIDHMDQGDLDKLQHVLVLLRGEERADRGGLLDLLQSIHDDERCQEDMQREGLNVPEESKPAATSRGRQLWEGFKEVNRDLRRRSR